MRKPTPRSDAFNGHDTPPPCGLSEKFLHLWRFIADDRWDDGTVRMPGTVTVLVDQGWIKAAVSDKEARATAFVTSDSLEGLLRAIDRGLQEEALEWRGWKEDPTIKKR